MQFREGHPTEEWVYGDGGPVVLLQSSAASLWNGASETGSSDYDAICAVEDGIHVIDRHDRDMIVLSDSEWSARIIEREDGLFVFQSLGHDETPDEIIDVAIAGEPGSALRFSQSDPAVRLMVGADTAADPIYDYTERSLAPGEYLVRAYLTDDAYIARLTQAEQAGADQPATAPEPKAE